MIQLLIIQYTVIITLLTINIISHINYKKKQKRYKYRDNMAAKYYETENMQAMFIKIAQLEERERIYRDIHDKAGHDIVGSLLVFQSLNYEDKIYQKAVEKLSQGMDKIRSIVHSTNKIIENRDSLKDICPDIKIYGDISIVPIYVYNVLENITLECVTNANKYGIEPVFELDITSRIVRFYTENKVKKIGIGKGTGIINLRNRAIAVGGSLSVTQIEKNFCLVCVMPIGN